MSKKKKIVIGAVCVAVAGVVAMNTLFGTKQVPAMAVNTLTLEPMTLTNTVSLTGTVESENGRKVYSTLTYPVEAVNVEVGDVVQQGDVLCQLKSDDLQLDLAQQQAAYAAAQQQAQFQMETSQKAYENAKSNYENNLDSSILSADAAVRSAKAAVSDAMENYRIARSQLEGNVDDARDALDDAQQALAEAEGRYEAILGSVDAQKAAAQAEFQEKADAYEAARADYEDELSRADQDVDAAKKALEEAKKAANPDNDKTDEEINSDPSVQKAQEELDRQKQIRSDIREGFSGVEAAYNTAEAAYNSNITAIESQASGAASAIASANAQVASADAAYDQARDAFSGNSLAQYDQAIGNAKRSNSSAVSQKEAAHNAMEQQIDSLKDNIRGSEIAAQSTAAQQYAVQKLQNTLEDTTITAPVSGTVTAVYAKVGDPGNGLLFVIEDTQSLKVSTKIKEYDVANIREGMQTTIKSDATGDREITGQVSKIDPVAIKSADGNLQSDSEVEFATDVQVLEQDTGLRIGMSARLNVVLETKDNVFGVPYDAVTTLPDGSSVVMTVQQTEKGYVAKSIPVTTGMETDFYIEISGDGITSGTVLLSSTANVMDGQPVTPDFAATAGQAAGMTVGQSEQAAAGAQ